MSKFEFIAVLLSIIFGLALTNLLSGMLRAFFRRDLTDTRIAWTILVGNLLLVNWWLFFRWSDNEVWHYYEYVYLVGWATVHYLMAVSLFPFTRMPLKRSSNVSWNTRRPNLPWPKTRNNPISCFP